MGEKFTDHIGVSDEDLKRIHDDITTIVFESENNFEASNKIVAKLATYSDADKMTAIRFLGNAYAVTTSENARRHIAMDAIKNLMGDNA